MDKKDIKMIAQTILDTAKIKEESYDHKAADEAEKSQKFVDFSSFYTKSLEKSANQACKENGVDSSISPLIYLLLSYTWNDIQSWAENTLK